MKRTWSSNCKTGNRKIVGDIVDSFPVETYVEELTQADLEALKADAIAFAASHQPQRVSERILEARLDASEFEAWADRFSKDDKEAALERARAFTENMIRGHRNEARVARLLQRAGLEIILFEPSLLPQYQAQSPDIAIVLPGERVIIVECKSKTRVQDYVEEPTNDGFYRDYPDSLLLCDVNRWQQHTRAQRRWCSEHGYELIDTVAVIELPMLPDAALVEAKADELGWSIEDVENDTLFLSGYIVVDGSTVSDWETVNVSNRWSNGDNRVYSVPSHLFLSMEELIDHAREQMHTKPRLKRGNR